jgi:hypothetical protein
MIKSQSIPLVLIHRFTNAPLGYIWSIICQFVPINRKSVRKTYEVYHGAKICKKIYEIAQRENQRNSNSVNLLVAPAQTQTIHVYM